MTAVFQLEFVAVYFPREIFCTADKELAGLSVFDLVHAHWLDGLFVLGDEFFFVHN
jgi:hypothetical protein